MLHGDPVHPWIDCGQETNDGTGVSARVVKKKTSGAIVVEERIHRAIFGRSMAELTRNGINIQDCAMGREHTRLGFRVAIY